MHDELSPERAILQTVGALLVLVGGFAVLGLLMPDQVRAVSLGFVDATGWWGVFVGVYLADFLTLPIPPDAWLAAGRIGGLPFVGIVSLGSVASILGGFSGFLAARRLAGTPWFEARAGAGVARARALFGRYGGVALAVSAITPLPFSLLSYAAGSLGLPARRYLLIALLRIPRIVGYLGAIELGVIDLFGA